LTARDPSNLYAAPDSNVTVESFSQSVVGGTLEQTLAGNTHWTVGEIFTDSWNLVRGFKGTCWLVLLAYLAAMIVMGIVEAVIVAVTESAGVTKLVEFVLTIFVLWPLWTGIFMLGVRRAAGAETRAGMVGDYFPMAGRIAGLMILQTVLIVFGFLMLVLPGIYLAVSYMLALPLLVDRGLGVWESLETSRRVVGTCWFRVAGLVVCCGLISLLCAFTLGIGAIWLWPLTVITFGMLYHRLAGYAGGDAG